ncbi:MAG: TOMM precursor leader peptide-binding protein [Chloroflexota bacterium]
MVFLKIVPSASLVPTQSGVAVLSEMGTFQIEGQNMSNFLDAILPALQRGGDLDDIARSVPDYAPQDVSGFLDLLEQCGAIQDAQQPPPAGKDATPTAPEPEGWKAQKEFFRQWVNRPAAAMQKLRQSHVLLVGLEAWGSVLATDLAEAGLGEIHLLDDAPVTDADLLPAGRFEAADKGKLRSVVIAEQLAAAAPWCKVTTGRLMLTDDGTLAIEDDDTTWDLVVAATRADDLRLLHAIALYAHEAAVPSIYGSLSGTEAMIGPVVMPGQTACWNCGRLRRLGASDSPHATFEMHHTLLAMRPRTMTRSVLAPMAAVTGHLLSLEALKLISGYAPSTLQGTLLVQDLVTHETSTHRIISVPSCVICGEATPEDSEEHDPFEHGTAVQHDIFEAIRTPEDLQRTLAGWIDRRTGVIKDLVIEPGGSEGLPVSYVAVASAHAEDGMQPTPPEHGFGKGITHKDAMLSAVGEAIERYSAARFRRIDLLRLPLANLQGEVIDPRHLCLYSDAQYDRPFFPFPRFDPNQPIEWTRGRWLDSREPVWIPALPVYLNFDAYPREYFCQVTSSGLAAGTDLHDAGMRALFELVERDAFLLTWLARRPARRLLLDDSDLDLPTRQIMHELESLGATVELYLLDVGTNIPSVLCLGVGDGINWPGATVALATHLDPTRAVSKAILEQGQIGPHLRNLMQIGKQRIPESPEDVWTFTDHALYYAPIDKQRAFDFLRFSEIEPVNLSDLPEPECLSLQACAERLANSGVRIALADVTSPDVARSPFRVVRAVGTDMQQLHCGHLISRLGNPRLNAMLDGPVNPDPHPLC